MIFEDEHALSFLFRTQTAAGAFNYTNLLNSTNNFSQHGFISPEIKNLYRRYDEALLFRILDHGYEIKHHNSLFYPAELIRNFFNGESIKIRHNRSRYITFCPKCIELSILENGVGYLKKDWELTGICLQHNEYLYCCNSMKEKGKTVHFLNEILSGRIPESAYQLTPDIKYKKSTLETKNCISDLLYFKPCLENEYHKWLRRNRIEIIEYARSSTSLKLPGTFKWLLEKENHIDLSVLNEIYNHLIKSNMFEFNTTFSELKEIITEKFGHLNKNAFSIQTYKSKKSNCYACFKNCTNNKTFARLRIYSPVMYSRTPDENGVTSAFVDNDPALSTSCSGHPCPLHPNHNTPSLYSLYLGWIEKDKKFNKISKISDLDIVLLSADSELSTESKIHLSKISK